MDLQTRLERIENLLAEIYQLPSFVPNDAVNRAFSELVALVVGDSRNDIEFQSLDSLPVNIPVSAFCRKIGIKAREAASLAESEMEKFWATKILESDSAFAALSEFPYTQNYRDLVERELTLVEKSGKRITAQDRVLIVGTGPLPMTAFEIAQQTRAQVDQVDCSHEAMALCAQISERLGINGDCVFANGKDVELRHQYSLVLIAGLAGATIEDKQQIVDHLRESVTEDGRIVMRGAHGLRELLYPSFDPTEIGGLSLIEAHHPLDHVINSVFVYSPTTIPLAGSAVRRSLNTQTVLVR